MSQQNLRQMMQMLNGEDGIKKMMLSPAYNTDAPDGGTSQAELVADMVNQMRLDVKMAGEHAGVDIEVQFMTPERAADLLQGLVRGESLEFIDVITDIESKREQVIAELADWQTVYEHRKVKHNVTNAPTEYDFGGLDVEDDVDPEDAEWEADGDDEEAEADD